MLFKLIAELRGEAGTTGADQEYPLPSSAGGHASKGVQYWVQIVSYGGTAPKIGFKIKDGPNGMNFITHTSVASTAVGTTTLWVFDSTAVGATRMIGEYLQGILLVGGTATGDWIQVRIWELRKPF